MRRPKPHTSHFHLEFQRSQKVRPHFSQEQVHHREWWFSLDRLVSVSFIVATQIVQKIRWLRMPAMSEPAIIVMENNGCACRMGVEWHPFYSTTHTFEAIPVFEMLFQIHCYVNPLDSQSLLESNRFRWHFAKKANCRWNATHESIEHTQLLSSSIFANDCVGIEYSNDESLTIAHSHCQPKHTVHTSATTTSITIANSRPRTQITQHIFRFTKFPNSRKKRKKDEANTTNTWKTDFEIHNFPIENKQIDCRSGGESAHSIDTQSTWFVYIFRWDRLGEWQKEHAI